MEPAMLSVSAGLCHQPAVCSPNGQEPTHHLPAIGDGFGGHLFWRLGFDQHPDLCWWQVILCRLQALGLRAQGFSVALDGCAHRGQRLRRQLTGAQDMSQQLPLDSSWRRLSHSYLSWTSLPTL